MYSGIVPFNGDWVIFLVENKTEVFVEHASLENFNKMDLKKAGVTNVQMRNVGNMQPSTIDVFEVTNFHNCNTPIFDCIEKKEVKPRARNVRYVNRPSNMTAVQKGALNETYITTESVKTARELFNTVEKRRYWIQT